VGTWTYLIAYVAPYAGAGNAVTTRPRPVDSAEDIADVEGWLRRNGVAAAVVTNVVLLKRRRFARWKDKGTTVTRAGEPSLA
jgi:hypothetical protein